METFMDRYAESVLAVCCLTGVLATCIEIFLSEGGAFAELIMRYTQYLL
ncbi:hypothetical protein SAMN02910400_01138 [Lachnospiraceae bacterium C10]|jgi:hypothetical protein|nr:hypothetical protein [Lachnospiraceae bacterium]SCW52482.1 hypothetical protein SAMN02910400_01138 [Lachnospiraceae bacterium C10]SDW63997.1 hypothetical protein SAMN05216391_11316 [Lachnospiraceae bacterium KHCPX20]